LTVGAEVLDVPPPRRGMTVGKTASELEAVIIEKLRTARPLTR
jgi:hypothetical protein